MELEFVHIQGAREHNLRIEQPAIPKRQLVVFTGVSGSGKSSLAFDTLYAEGQRRYVESLSSYARQFLGQMEKPQVDHVRGLVPTIAIEQKTASANPRSTVGTITEIADYLRVLYARVGVQCCPRCNRPVQPLGVDAIVEQVQRRPGQVLLLAPIVENRKGEFRDALTSLRERGFVRVRVNGVVRRLEEEIILDKRHKHTIELIVDRVQPARTGRSRLADSVETALREGSGTMMCGPADGAGAVLRLSNARACPDCRIGLPELSPQSFSFNSPLGMCVGCNPDVYVPCEVCKGQRYNAATLQVHFKGLDIAAVLGLSVREAAALYAPYPKLHRILATLSDVGLDYVKLGQPAPTLSGGEAQRVKLSRELARRDTGRTLYVLDEPTTGLHFHDIRKLLEVLDRLVAAGNTVVIIEHNLDVIKCADYVIDLGPGGGDAGGAVVATGTPEAVAAHPGSFTGAYLKTVLRAAATAV